MLISQKSGTLNPENPSHKIIDFIELEWFETNKRILTKRSKLGKELTLKFLNENQNLTQDDILFEDESTIIAVKILECDCVIIKPKNNFELASICYEIGNKHVPLFFQNDEILVAYEAPLFKLMVSSGYEVLREERKLLTPLKTSVPPHGNSSETLFNKIMKMTT